MYLRGSKVTFVSALRNVPHSLQQENTLVINENFKGAAGRRGSLWSSELSMDNGTQALCCSPWPQATLEELMASSLIYLQPCVCVGMCMCVCVRTPTPACVYLL